MVPDRLTILLETEKEKNIKHVYDWFHILINTLRKLKIKKSERVLVDGIRNSTDESGFRCCQCGKMQESGSIYYWIPRYKFRAGDSLNVLRSALTTDHHHEGWCYKCSMKYCSEKIKNDKE